MEGLMRDAIRQERAEFRAILDRVQGSRRGAFGHALDLVRARLDTRDRELDLEEARERFAPLLGRVKVTQRCDECGWTETVEVWLHPRWEEETLIQALRVTNPCIAEWPWESDEWGSVEEARCTVPECVGNLDYPAAYIEDFPDVTLGG